MTQLHEPLTIFKLHKILPKKMSHIKEEAKVKFINAVVESYRINENFGTINFDASTYNGKTVTIVYNPSNIKFPIYKVVEQVMSQWYFSNLEKNENVYFYRFINIFRSLLTEIEWIETTDWLSNSNNATLKENFNQYTEYRRKLNEIDIIIAQENFNAKEQYV